jgi:hypothetical protein
MLTDDPWSRDARYTGVDFGLTHPNAGVPDPQIREQGDLKR